MGLTPREMRTAIATNPQWDILTAFRQISGFEPTSNQVKQANDYGGLRDGGTIASIPDQMASRLSQFWGAYPGIVAPLDSLWRTIDLRSFHRIRIKSDFDQMMSRAGFTLEARKALDGLTFTQAHPVVAIYREILGRDPDEAGSAFWLGAYGEWRGTLSDLEASFRAGIRK